MADSKLVLLVFAFLLCQSASAREVSGHARKAVEVIQQLRAIGLSDSPGGYSGPPAKVPGLLRALNAELRALILEDLNDARQHTPASAEEIFDQLRAAGWEEVPDHKWNAYGEIRNINFDWKVGYDPDLLVVSTELWIPCGSSDPDSAIYVFQGMRRKWDLVLAAESDFDGIWPNGEGGMEYKLSPPDSAGKWFLVLGHVPPSCRQARPALSYKVLRPSSTPDKPIVLVAGKERIDTDYNPPFRLEAHEDWFAVTLAKSRQIDLEPGIDIFRYEVSNKGARRIHPLALTPQDFLDQWAQLGWEDARQWTNPSVALAGWHEKLEKITPGSVEIEAVRRCSGTEEGDQEWLVEMAVDQPPNPTFGANALYVGVAKKNGVFSIESINKVRPAGCSTKNLSTELPKNELPAW